MHTMLRLLIGTVIALSVGFLSASALVPGTAVDVRLDADGAAPGAVMEISPGSQEISPSPA
jgi:hypothetical protein